MRRLKTQLAGEELLKALDDNMEFFLTEEQILDEAWHETS